MGGVVAVRGVALRVILRGMSVTWEKGSRMGRLQRRPRLQKARHVGTLQAWGRAERTTMKVGARRREMNSGAGAVVKVSRRIRPVNNNTMAARQKCIRYPGA